MDRNGNATQAWQGADWIGSEWKGNASQAFNSVDPLIDNGNVEPKSTRGNTHG